MAVSSSGQGSRGTVEMQGYSHTSAPSERRRPDRVPARSFGRVTTTVLPFRGRRSNQSNCSARAHTCPTTMTAGLFTPASAARRGRSARVALVRRWAGVVPLSTVAAGVSGAMPASSRPRQMAGRADTPMRNTRVPPVRTRASKSMSSSLPERWWPVTMWREEQQSRWVTGMPP